MTTHAEIGHSRLKQMYLFRGVGVMTACATKQQGQMKILLHEPGLFMAAVAQFFLR